MEEVGERREINEKLRQIVNSIPEARLRHALLTCELEEEGTNSQIIRGKLYAHMIENPDSVQDLIPLCDHLTPITEEAVLNRFVFDNEPVCSTTTQNAETTTTTWSNPAPKLNHQASAFRMRRRMTTWSNETQSSTQTRPMWSSSTINAAAQQVYGQPLAQMITTQQNNFSAWSNSPIPQEPPPLLQTGTSSFSQPNVTTNPSMDKTAQDILTALTTSLANAMNASVLSNLNRPAEPNYAGFVNDLKSQNVYFPSYGNDDPVSFVKRLERIGELHNLNESHLLKFAEEFLTGSARQWFQAFRSEFANWDYFKTYFISAFPKVYSEREARINLWSRTQAEGENMAQFVSHVKLLNSKLNTPFPELQLISVISDNMHPKYKREMRNVAPFTSINNLILYFQEFERHLLDLANYKPPPAHLAPKLDRRGRNFDNKEMKLAVAEVNTRSHNVITDNHIAIAESRAGDARAPGTGNTSKQLACWNCGGPHTFTSCREPQTLFCFRCGEKGITSKQHNCKDQKKSSTTTGTQTEPTEN